MKTFAVIGLGRFGSAVAAELSSLGHEVLAVDKREDHVQRVAGKVARAITGDAKDPSVLRTLGVRNYGCAVVAVGDGIGNSALITLNLKKIGVKRVICKAQSYVHRKVLEKIGADRVVLPEHKMRVKLAQGLSNSNVLNSIELSEDSGIVGTAVPREWHYEAIQNLNVQARYKVNIVAVRRGKDRTLNVAPGASYVVKPNGTVVTLGRTEGINHLQDL